MRAAYQMAALEPAQISLLECHATGTPVGDACELRSTGRVFAGLRGIPIGSVKSNVGHPMTAAGMAGLLKLLGAFAARTRPATLHVGKVKTNPVASFIALSSIARQRSVGRQWSENSGSERVRFRRQQRTPDPGRVDRASCCARHSSGAAAFSIATSDRFHRRHRRRLRKSRSIYPRAVWTAPRFTAHRCD